MEAIFKGEWHYRFKRVLQVIIKIVEHHVSQTCAYQNTSDNPRGDVVQLLLGNFNTIALDRMLYDLIAGEEGSQIHQTIPTNGEGTDGDERWIHMLGNQVPPRKRAYVYHGHQDSKWRLS